MASMNRRTAWRIASVSVLLAAIASPAAWYMARERAEEDTVALAMQESRRLLWQFDSVALAQAGAQQQAQRAAEALTGGLFDIAEMYAPDGRKLAESMTQDGAAIEDAMPKHGEPRYQQASYESMSLPTGRWVLRVFVPLRAQTETGPISGYFEGVRLIPAWQEAQMVQGAAWVAMLVALASLLCGAVIYPVVVHLSAENERKAREVLDSHLAMMEALGRAIARRDSDTGAHNYRVAWIATRIGEVLGVAGSRMQALIVGSFLHDVGKIGIPDAILLKPGRLDDEEMAVMRTHVDQGETIVAGISWLEEAVAIVTGHHEKWDGTGYPRRLSGETIPLGARIFAVADVFDALTSRRPYKEPMSFEKATGIIRHDAGTHFDPAVVEAFMGIAHDIHETLTGRSEDSCRAMLEDKLRLHFGF